MHIHKNLDDTYVNFPKKTNGIYTDHNDLLGSIFKCPNRQSVVAIIDFKVSELATNADFMQQLRINVNFSQEIAQNLSCSSLRSLLFYFIGFQRNRCSVSIYSYHFLTMAK